MIKETQDIKERMSTDNRQYAVISNPSYVYPPEEYYPLAPALKYVDGLRGVLMDMDGTTTTTEELCIYSLEQMVRRMSGKNRQQEWTGLDRGSDYPYIIGNSTTKHVEYLVGKYDHIIDPVHASRAFLQAAAWTIQKGMDRKRREEVAQNLRKLDLHPLLEKINRQEITPENAQEYAHQLPALSFAHKVAVGIDIYYQVYHEILGRLKAGRNEEIKKEVFGGQPGNKNLIAPMPGIPILLPLLKGWLGASVSLVAQDLLDDYQQKRQRELSQEEKTAILRSLTNMAVWFEKHPAQVGLVTSSIHYEADIVIEEVFHVIRDYYQRSPLPGRKKAHLLNHLKDYRTFYDAFVTASDSSEIRLKPHRDLYSLALHQLGLAPEQFSQVIGFEDSQSGTIAIRAAGIGCCVAVPFAQTSAHDFEAAVHVVKGGIPQALIEHKLFVNQEEKQTIHYE